MKNLADQLRRDIDARRRELRPLVEEAQQLEALLAAWDREVPDGHRAQTVTVPVARPRRAPRAPRQSAAARREAILAVLGSRPGIDAKALAHELGVSHARLSQLLGPLQRSGQVTRAHGGLFADVPSD